MQPTESPWVEGLTIAEALSRNVEEHPRKEALVFSQQGVRLTYRQFQAEVQRVACALIALGVQPGEHVGIWCTNRPQWVLIQFAAACIGSPLVNINPAYRGLELEHVLRQAQITVLVMLDKFKTSHYYEILGRVCPEFPNSIPGHLRSRSFPGLRWVVGVKNKPHPGVLPWDEFLDKHSTIPQRMLDRRSSEVKPQDVVNIQYTSGTTGFPKGAQLTHRNLLLNAFHAGNRMELGREERICVPVPFYHCFGCVLGTLLCVVHGCTLVIPGEAFDAESTLRVAEAESCSALYGVPAMFIAELSVPEIARFRLNRLRTGIMAGSPCPVEVMRRVIETLGARQMTIAYGLTEASPVITQTCVSDTLERRVATVGKPLPGLEVKVADPSQLEALPPGEQGELMVRGHCVMKGYHGLPRETALAITRDGWLRTGDLATQTPDGYFKITGRIKDLIIRGGENIYPSEIEGFLFTLPQVRDVQVVGVPDSKLGESVSAWIILKDGCTLTEQNVKEYCRGKIAHYKIPKYVVFLREFPATITGKTQKFRLREMGIQRFQLERLAAVEMA